MGTPYVGEIRMFAGNFAPSGWAICDGSELSISDNDALYALLGNTYGGNGQTTFALPDLRGRAPLHRSATYPTGANGGSETVTLTTNQIPQHTHTAYATSNNAEFANPDGMVWAKSSYASYTPAAPTSAMLATAPAGGSQPHDNMMPSLAINYIIALAGVYPSSN